MRYHLCIAAALLATLGCARVLVNWSTPDIRCRPYEKRLYVLTDNYSTSRTPHRITVYCGNNTSPVAELSSGIKNLGAQIESDFHGNIYLSDYAPKYVSVAPAALLIYNRNGHLTARIAKFGMYMPFATNRETGTTYVVTTKGEPHWATLSIVSGNQHHHVQRRRIPADLGLLMDMQADKSGSLFFQTSDYRMSVMNTRSWNFRRLNIPAPTTFTIGADNKLYTRSFEQNRIFDARTSEWSISFRDEIVRVYNPKNMHLIRSFRDVARGYSDIGVIAASSDGTVALAHDKARNIEVYSPAGIREAIIERIGHVGDLLFGSHNTLYVLLYSRSRLGRPGVYAFQAGTSEIARAYLLGEHQAPGSMAYVPGKSMP